LAAIIRLFCLLNERDVFIRDYTKLLGDRLLNKTFLSRDLEAQMLEKLKIECGAATISKLSKMFTDVDLSIKLASDFKEKCP
jgi:hypothetical protein